MTAYLIICSIIAFGLFYAFLPPLNVCAPTFWVYLIFVTGLFFFGLATILASREKKGDAAKSGEKKGITSKAVKRLGLLLVGLLLTTGILALTGIPLLRADSYAAVIRDRLTQKDISEYTPTIENVPLMDRNTAELLASRTMGSLVEEVSQFNLGRSRQINYNGRPIRVEPLEYAGFFKWVNNRKNGIPSYISVDMMTQKTEIHKIEGGMRYTPSGYFGDKLERYLRFKYPTVMMGEPVFEVDDEGKPYWVIPKLVHRVGAFGGTDVSGALIVDAVTGAIANYELADIPSHVDNVYPASVLTDLYNLHGKYQGGFWNAKFGQKNVVQVTEGYNYIPKDDDIYIYTGVTSVVADESNIGFIFVNMRTGLYEYYEIAGAEEFSAMRSAEGAVQHLNYVATFPLLLSIENQPTYCVALKDAGGLVKMYGLVNMSQYQIVVTGATINDCLRSYRTALKNNGQTVIEEAKTERTAVAEEIRAGEIGGTTVFYVRFENDSKIYAFLLSDNEKMIFVDAGDLLTYDTAEAAEGDIVPATLLSATKQGKGGADEAPEASE